MIDDKINEYETFLHTRCIVFHEQNIPVHIVRWEFGWRNGYISEVANEFIILDEFKMGRVPIFFKEMKRVEKFIKTEVENDLSEM